MKPVIILFLLFLFQPSIYSQPLVADNKLSTYSQVSYLTTNDFKLKIFDYTKSKEWKYKGTLPAIIDFYADWCRPCKLLSPIIEAASEDYKGKVLVYKVNIDKEPELAQIFGIQSIPSVLFIPAKEQPQISVGLLTKEEINSKISTIYAKVK